MFMQTAKMGMGMRIQRNKRYPVRLRQCYVNVLTNNVKNATL